MLYNYQINYLGVIWVGNWGKKFLNHFPVVLFVFLSLFLHKVFIKWASLGELSNLWTVVPSWAYTVLWLLSSKMNKHIALLHSKMPRTRQCKRNEAEKKYIAPFFFYILFKINIKWFWLLGSSEHFLFAVSSFHLSWTWPTNQSHNNFWESPLK